ncbi:hypothetical protein GLP21_12170 [Photobacterium carnosum]|uniref:Uncharacterized protein n=1 Tax=Photobacterium carnosum TaxID=2023717 RepID=A0A2N4UW40_9GAMM|nr:MULTISPECIES: hypothetical protein [Photobacterium]MCD9475821.1 hypothetical protein [Photobacterium phosphoreum]MCD9485872.1 hypothetical protein [Photobacterium iliopiscarium]MCD9507683.1 hypothetical protein [Photobacterium phosphoreum]MCD9538196.1 hypothetical protein [Photobacterium carnosum]MCD9543000.1 hypothetical protein [Photobacterium carnosum]
MMNDKNERKTLAKLFIAQVSAVIELLNPRGRKNENKRVRISLRTHKEVNLKPTANKNLEKRTFVGELKNKLKRVHVGIWVTLLFGLVTIIRMDDVVHVYRWIKVQSYELMAGGQPTMSTDPIGVFDRTYIAYSSKYKDLPKEDLTPLVFDSITRYKLDALRFTAAFGFEEGTSYADNYCRLSTEGGLLRSTGGVVDDNYILVLTCDGRDPKVLIGAKLIALPPDINQILTPADYYLYYKQ